MGRFVGETRSEKVRLGGDQRSLQFLHFELADGELLGLVHGGDAILFVVFVAGCFRHGVQQLRIEPSDFDVRRGADVGKTFVTGEVRSGLARHVPEVLVDG